MLIHYRTFGNSALDNPSSQKLRKSSYGIVLFRFPILLKQEGLLHAVFSRHGGKSNHPYHFLNTSYETNDSAVNVSSNLKLIKTVIHADRLVFMKQAHGSEITIPDEQSLNNLAKTPKADALITNIPGISLMVKQADCQAVILFDPVKRVIANVHCGWRGNTINILGKVVKRMESEFGCYPSDLIAAIGPSLGPCCAEFITHKNIFPKEFHEFMRHENHFDLWGISSMQLVRAGLDEKNIETAKICTKCNTDLFYSYRAEKDTGRFATVVMLLKN
ncbi:MAG: peptidoglycan editing factor PgeF [Deltaproteobacteria bacterium]|nr:peptidoglycan editing factor PgeF [Deltaproteobacteria bacterium]